MTTGHTLSSGNEFPARVDSSAKTGHEDPSCLDSPGSRNGQSDLAFELLNKLPYGIVCVDERLRIEFMNEAALSLVQQNDGLSVRDNRLIAQNTSCTAEIQELVKRASEYGLPRREEGVWAIKLPRRRDRRCLEIMAVLLPGPSCFQRGSDLTSALFIFDPDEEVCPNKEIVAQLYGLTEAEARVAVMLMEGKTLEQASTLLQRTKETVRKQLQSIFDKTNTNRQSELIRLLLRGPAGLRFRAGECCVQRR